ncbi:hypothetical protein BKA70DRAFT_1234932 [Coprinopsis sp. MPI-PUGE-AT-0042]|nr:hypothetical protein BKA70DRAFT_1234932 [Coprinopsis sp. MPI-PUGE-AT-0042]
MLIGDIDRSVRQRNREPASARLKKLDPEHNSPGVLLVSGSDQVLGGGEERRESRRDEHSSGPERATPRETGNRRSGQTGKRRRQARGLRVSESGAIDRNGSGTEGTRGSLRIRKRNGRMSGPKSIPKVSWMAEGFGSGPEVRECSGTRDMDRKRAEASRSSVARRRRQGDGIEQRWDGWGSDEVQPASVGPEMVRSSAVRGQGGVVAYDRKRCLRMRSRFRLGNSCCDFRVLVGE